MKVRLMATDPDKSTTTELPLINPPDAIVVGYDQVFIKLPYAGKSDDGSVRYREASFYRCHPSCLNRE